MSSAALLAVAAAGAGVAAAWELLAAVERPRAVAWLGRALAPARTASAPATTAERRRLSALAAAGLLAAGWIVSGPLLGLAAALGAPAAVLALLRARRRRHVESARRGAAPAARAIAAGLAAGRSVRGALAEASGGVDGAAGLELAAAARALGVGEATEDVLERLRVRCGGGPWDTLVAAVLLQRDAGGDLAALLRDLAASLEAGERAERDARAATAQSRFTAWLVAGLPFGAALVAELGSPGFVAGLLSEPIPGLLAGTAAGLQVLAILIVRRLARAGWEAR